MTSPLGPSPVLMQASRRVCIVVIVAFLGLLGGPMSPAASGAQSLATSTYDAAGTSYDPSVPRVRADRQPLLRQGVPLALAAATLRNFHCVARVGVAANTEVRSFGPGAMRAGEPKWPTPTADNCTQCAVQIQKIMGGERKVITGGGRPRLGGSVNDPEGAWMYHEVVVKGDRVYDGFTGPNGLPIDQFKSQFTYADDIDFGF